MSSIMRRRNGLFASSVMGMLLSWWRLRTPHLKTGRPVALSSWLRRQPRRPTARAVSFIGPVLPISDVRFDGEFRRDSRLVVLMMSFVDFDPNRSSGDEVNTHAHLPPTHVS